MQLNKKTLHKNTYYKVKPKIINVDRFTYITDAFKLLFINFICGFHKKMLLRIKLKCTICIGSILIYYIVYYKAILYT